MIRATTSTMAMADKLLRPRIQAVKRTCTGLSSKVIAVASPMTIRNRQKISRTSASTTSSSAMRL